MLNTSTLIKKTSQDTDYMASLSPRPWNVGTMQYSARWRSLRRGFHQYFNQTAIEKYRSVQLNEVRSLLGRILDSPEKTTQHLRL